MALVEIIEEPNFTVLINGLSHVMLSGELSAIHSYIDKYEPKGEYFIEYCMGNGIVTAQYDKRELWEQILLKIQSVVNGKANNGKDLAAS